MNTEFSKWTKSGVTILAAIHLIVTMSHGNAHKELAIGLSPEKNLFVIVVIVIAPLVGAILVWTRYSAVGLWIFSLAMLGATVFGVYHHYLMVSPDNVAHLPPGPESAQSRFTLTALVLAIIELASTLFGLYFLLSRRRQQNIS